MSEHPHHPPTENPAAPRAFWKPERSGDLIEILAQVYLEAGLPAPQAMHSAVADYVCHFHQQRTEAVLRL